MKTVVHILNTGSFSGAENVVITLIRQMCKQYGMKYRFIYVSLNGKIEEKLKEENIEYYPVGKISTNSMKRMIRECKPDIIHAHDYTASMICAAVHGHIPVISHLHNNSLWIKRVNLKSMAYLLTTTQYKKILLVSSAIRDEYIFGNIVENKMLVIGNPVSLESITKKAEVEEKTAYDIVFLGRLSAPKNPIRFIRIIKKIVQKQNDIKVGMIGDGELRGDCERVIQEENLESNIDLLGFINNPYPVLKKAGLLCVTSDWEGFGLMAVEALALGVPVVSTHIGGLKEIVTNECGKFCNTDEEFIDEIEKILTNAEYRWELSLGALKRAKEIENIEEYAVIINEVYSELL